MCARLSALERRPYVGYVKFLEAIEIVSEFEGDDVGGVGERIDIGKKNVPEGRAKDSTLKHLVGLCERIGFVTVNQNVGGAGL